MPNASAITLNNGTDDVVVSPDSVSTTHVLYQDLDEAVINERILLHFDRPARDNGIVRRTVRLNVPLARQDAAGNAMPPEMMSARIEYVAPRGTTVSERQVLAALIASAASNSAITSIITTPEWVW